MDSNPIDEAIGSGRIEATEDVEGHMPFKRVTDSVEADVEAHGARASHVDGPDTEDTDDTDGHGITRKF